MKNKIDRVWEQLFEYACKEGDNLYELKIVYKDLDGRTIERSWIKRDKRLENERSEYEKIKGDA